MEGAGTTTAWSALQRFSLRTKKESKCYYVIWMSHLHKTKAETPPISQDDYERIFNVVFSTLSHAYQDLTRACFHFNFCAAAILIEKFGLPAKPSVGNAAYCTSTEPLCIIGFLNIKGEEFKASQPNEHCWLQVGNWHIDFMAPMFPELLNRNNHSPCERRAFMKLTSTAKSGPDQLTQAGDFFARGDQARTLDAVDTFGSILANTDLMQLCSKWFNCNPSNTPTKIGVGDGSGKISTVVLQKPHFDGSW